MVLAVALHRWSLQVLTGNDDGSLRVWSLGNGQHSLNQGHHNTIAALCAGWTGEDERDPCGRDLVFTCGFEGEVLQWEMLEVRGRDAVGASLKCNLLGRTKAPPPPPPPVLTGHVSSLFPY